MLKLQVVLVPPGPFLPQTANLTATFNTTIASARRFLHITLSTKTMMEVCDEISARFHRLYPHEALLEISRLQDSNENDLDPDYIVGHVFDPKDNVVRVILDSDWDEPQPEPQLHALPNSTGVSFNLSDQLTPMLAPNGKRKRQSEYFGTASRIPSKKHRYSLPSIWGSKRQVSLPGAPIYEVPETASKPSSLSKMQSMDEIEASAVSESDFSASTSDSDSDYDASHISLPPPEAKALTADPKKATAVRPARNVSGTLEIPENAKAKITKSSPKTKTPPKTTEQVTPTPKTQKRVGKPAQSEHQELPEAVEEESEILTKEEIMRMFKNGMRIPGKMRKGGKIATELSTTLLNQQPVKGKRAAAEKAVSKIKDWNTVEKSTGIAEIRAEATSNNGLSKAPVLNPINPSGTKLGAAFESPQRLIGAHAFATSTPISKSDHVEPSEVANVQIPALTATTIPEESAEVTPSGESATVSDGIPVEIPALSAVRDELLKAKEQSIKKREEERRRKEEEKKKREEERLRKQEERKKKVEEEKAKREEAKRKREEEKKKLAEALRVEKEEAKRKLAESLAKTKKAEAEALAEAQKHREVEAAKQLEMAKLIQEAALLKQQEALAAAKAEAEAISRAETQAEAAAKAEATKKQKEAEALKQKETEAAEQRLAEEASAAQKQREATEEQRMENEAAAEAVKQKEAAILRLKELDVAILRQKEMDALKQKEAEAAKTSKAAAAAAKKAEIAAAKKAAAIKKKEDAAKVTEEASKQKATEQAVITLEQTAAAEVTAAQLAADLQKRHEMYTESVNRTQQVKQKQLQEIEATEKEKKAALAAIRAEKAAATKRDTAKRFAELCAHKMRIDGLDSLTKEQEAEIKQVITKHRRRESYLKKKESQSQECSMVDDSMVDVTISDAQLPTKPLIKTPMKTVMPVEMTPSVPVAKPLVSSPTVIANPVAPASPEAKPIVPIVHATPLRAPVTATSENSSSSESEDDSDSDSDSSVEVDTLQKRPRVVNTPKNTSTTSVVDPKKTVSFIETPKPASATSVARVSVASRLKRQSLVSLTDLAARGVPEVKEVSLRTPLAPDMSAESSSDSDTSSDSSSDSDTDSDSSEDEAIETGAARYIDPKKAKSLVGNVKEKRRKSGFFDLMKDAKK
ncbi:hypothetical protein BABINDRAFT_159586 [Babjeviella inositovora NRRL Y-12698]|uniref:Nucleolar protein Dnt1-like N-terminal domain-containing protein n=1 Tax=Babjeviella inositovora NRRL Y-12698 TaxID=984486 RepID=A0A1E3QZX3_9ASCO|nr:uncharacterized protein BABINDRAFT_159586 [Babjeviella inositovora NRRL Y-12698]ODQ83135.1 hypothetical protein BABINDRAFT_159586 [Babjeviella inositovora NRRL Y-12698]